MSSPSAPVWGGKGVRLPTLLVASSGGHLHELYELLPRFAGIDTDDVTWVTFDGAQARSLLRGMNVVLAPYPHPRDVKVTARHALLAYKTLRGRQFTHAISTGSSIAIPFLVLARLHGVSSHYIESATRLREPSLTGRLLALVPGVHLYSQTEGWRNPPWDYRGSVYDRYRAVPCDRAGPVHRVAVATGSARDYGFRRLLEAVVSALPPGIEVTWQTGSTSVEGLPIVARPEVPSEELATEFERADVVIAHAGVGLSLLALAAGRSPVLVPRRAARGEHVDDHQVEIAATLERRGLAVACEAENLTLGLLELAASRRVVRSEPAEPFHLNEGRAPRFPGASGPQRPRPAPLLSRRRASQPAGRDGTPPTL